MIAIIAPSVLMLVLPCQVRCEGAYLHLPGRSITDKAALMYLHLKNYGNLFWLGEFKVGELFGPGWVRV